MSQPKIQKPFSVRNIFLLCLLALIGAGQVLVLLTAWLQRLPPDYSLHQILLPTYAGVLRPEHDIFLYRAFCAAAFVMYAMNAFRRRSRIDEDGATSRLVGQVIAEGVLLAGLARTAFTLAHHPDSLFLQGCLIGLFVLSVSIKVMWSGIVEKSEVLAQNLESGLQRHTVGRMMGTVLACGFIAAAILIPDVHGLVGHVFRYDRFYHLDAFVMAPALASLKGGLPGIDIYSQYGLGMPVVLGRIAHVFGGLNYPSMLMLLMGIAVVYFMMWFLLLQRWLGSFWMALAGVALAITWQMFYYEE